MGEAKPLIPDCVDVNHAKQILSIYNEGKEEKAVLMVREHLSSCGACFRQFRRVNIIEEVCSGRLPDNEYLEFIEVVDRVGKERALEKQELQEIYMNFLSKAETIAEESPEDEEISLANDLYERLCDIENERDQRRESFWNNRVFSWGAVAAALTITVLSVGIMLNGPSLNSETRTEVNRELFPGYNDQTAYTPTEADKSARYQDMQQVFTDEFGLPVDKHLEKVYTGPVNNNNEILYSVSMNY